MDVRQLPKAELHVHIEGTLEPALMMELAEQNDVVLPYRSVEEIAAAYEFEDLQSFLDVYYLGATALRTADDFRALTTAYLARAHADGVQHVEMFFDPQTHTERDVPFSVFMPGFRAAMADAEAEWGMTSSLIMCFLRHLSPEAALDTLAASEAHLDRVVAVGLDSAEVGRPPELFVESFDRAKAMGLRAVAHAGEEGPAAFVRSALDNLGVERIDHGVHAEDDAALVDRLVAEQVPLTMCPLSNVKLKVFDRLEDHNIGRLLRAGVKVSINSDDPSYFGGYIGDAYEQTARAVELTDAEVVRIARNSIESSFASDDRKAELIAGLPSV